MKRKRRINRADAPPPTRKAQQLKVRKLMEMANDLENGDHFNVTRLSSIKTLCQEVKTAARFVLHLARQAQTRRDFGGDHKYYPAATVKRHRELAEEAFAEIEAYLKRRSDGREDRLRELLREAREANNEYRNIPYGAVRSIKSNRMLMIENAIYCALALTPPPQAITPIKRHAITPNCMTRITALDSFPPLRHWSLKSLRFGMRTILTKLHRTTQWLEPISRCCSKHSFITNPLYNKTVAQQICCTRLNGGNPQRDSALCPRTQPIAPAQRL